MHLTSPPNLNLRAHTRTEIRYSFTHFSPKPISHRERERERDVRSKTFILETDACYHGIGAVLMQDKHLIAYLSKALGAKLLGLSVYEKELMDVSLAVEKWRCYLLHDTFISRTDQCSIKYLMAQKISTPLQHKYLTKLLGFSYVIEYKRGLENKAADALSRREEGSEISCSALTVLQPQWIEELGVSYEEDVEAQNAIAESMLTPENLSLFNYKNGILRYKGRIYIGSNTDLRDQIINYMHTSSSGGHSGIQGTFQRVKHIFLWPGLKKQVEDKVKRCDVCQLNKHQTGKVQGLLQPLPIPDQAWQHISMDFIEQLPKSDGKDTIWVVVDRFTKYAHFIALLHPFTATQLAQIFLSEVYKLHGLPCSIVSDRDKLFTSQLWKELLEVIGVQQLLSTAYHPQTDGQTKRVYQCLESYLRCACGLHPKKWVRWLAMAEFWYNTNYHTAVKMTPFEALYGYKPTHLALRAYDQLTSVGLEELLVHRVKIQQQLKHSLQIAQERMKLAADKHRKERSFEVCDFVYLKLKPYRQLSLRNSKIWKLSPKYAGPFPIIARVGPVAYKLQLPPEAKIHPVFNVSVLKLRVGTTDRVTNAQPPIDEEA